MAASGLYASRTRASESPARAPSRDEQLAAFKAEHSIAPSDHIHEVGVTFA